MSAAYVDPGRARRCEWEPCSTTVPPWITAMRSARRMVLSRWATTMVVRSCWPTSVSMADCTWASLSASRAEVASSSSSTLGSRRRARAMAMRCFCPPERRTPRSPTRVRKPSGKCWMNSQQLALRATSSTRASNPFASAPHSSSKP
mmetsp:Transcript_52268/g.122587  ORF Transcript_52268/g.122587 Transcript_52268/m.122587 type:complete len:147 (+) Transcript_52268:166-606(+)